MSVPLSDHAEIMLLILTANGGVMDDADMRREFNRVLALTTTERALWREWIAPLVREECRKHLGKEH